jgi:hypothetical protein
LRLQPSYRDDPRVHDNAIHLPGVMLSYHTKSRPPTAGIKQNDHHANRLGL